MQEITYLKRTKKDGSVELHIHAFNGEYVQITNIYPEPKDTDIYYSFDEFEEFYDVDSWLDEGLKRGIFTSSLEPQL